MKPLIVTFPYAIAFWLAFLWAFAPEQRLVNRSEKKERSLRVLLVVQAVGMAGAFFIAFAAKAGRMGGQWSLWTGIAVLIAGSLLRRHCFRMLGRFFTGDVRVDTEQVVVDRGAYRWVRHPSYTAGILMFAGIGLALGNWWSFALILTASSIAYGYRIRVEERALLATLGPRYAEYAARRKRLIPFVI